MIKFYKNLLLFSAFFLFLAIFMMPARAADTTLESEIIAGQENNLVSADGSAQIKINLAATGEKISVRYGLAQIKNSVADFFTVPEGLMPGTDLYFLDFSRELASGEATIEVSLKYDATASSSSAYYYDWLDLAFHEAAGIKDETNGVIVFSVPLRRNIMFAVLQDKEWTGRASWYVHPKYKKELMAASRDFPKGTKLKVINLANNKEVIVTIKDYGPKLCMDWTEKEHRQMGPCVDRVIDLGKEAFLKLAKSTRQGIIQNVKIVPLLK